MFVALIIINNNKIIIKILDRLDYRCTIMVVNLAIVYSLDL